MTTDRTDLHTAAQKAIQLCRQGKWEMGLEMLSRIAEVDRKGTELPGIFYSYLGYGIARFQGKGREGLALCHHAIKTEFYEPENYVNLARIYLLRDRRRKGVQALERALKLNPSHPAAVRMAQEIGLRRRPVLPFLSRSNFLNRFLGTLRHQLHESKSKGSTGGKS